MKRRDLFAEPEETLSDEIELCLSKKDSLSDVQTPVCFVISCIGDGDAYCYVSSFV